MNNISVEILLTIYSFILPDKITLFFYFDYLNIKHVCKIWYQICDKYYESKKIKYCLMKKNVSYKHKPPVFLDYRLKKTKKTLWVLFSFEGKKLRKKIQTNYKDNSYYVQLNEYRLNSFKGLFYFIDVNIINDKFKKDLCQRCKELKYCAGYIEYWPNNINCNIDGCRIYSYNMFTSNNITYNRHFHLICFDCKETR
jgi:hypothetical protein